MPGGTLPAFPPMRPLRWPFARTNSRRPCGCRLLMPRLVDQCACAFVLATYKDIPRLRGGCRTTLCRFCFLIDDGFGDVCQRLIRGFFFFECGLQELHGFVQA